jgi:hypothetical protein
MKLLKQNFLFAIVAITLFAMAFTSGAYAVGSGLGEPGNMLQFDGSNYADYTNTFNPTHSFTIEGWFNAGVINNSFTNRGFLVFDESGAGDDYIALSVLPVNSGKFVEFTLANGVSSDVLLSGSPLTSSECYHIAVVVDGDLMKITMYIDGVFTSQTNLTAIGDPNNLGNMDNNFIGGNFTHGYNPLTGGSVMN